MGFFINPHRSRQLLDESFTHILRFVFRITLEIENQHIVAAETFAARINELTGTEEHFNTDVFVALFFFSFCFGFLFLGFLLHSALLNVMNLLLRFFILFSLLFVAEGLTVFLHQRGNFIAVKVEKRVFLDFFLGYFSSLIIFGFFFEARSGVVFLDFVCLLLIVIDFREDRKSV